MAEHHLYRAQICAVGQEVRGERMAQAVGGYVLANTCGPCGFFDNLPESESGHAFATVTDKQRIATSSFHDQGAG